ncbi:clathrin adaptor complex small chain-domain-containing protein [Endogone sp. FLAS-F59071]|nr:clathrin adaptor complex small chain-domain-containing protein [Endogone sp. FLAS-F59071]|eukprot:RUS22574.1 clathrin adaptor complex small chain-domain-containing protein [Endogone sp. FLAS-F59071]
MARGLERPVDDVNDLWQVILSTRNTFRSWLFLIPPSWVLVVPDLYDFNSPICFRNGIFTFGHSTPSIQHCESIHDPPQINWMLLVSRQGKVRLTKWFQTIPPKEKGKIVKEVNLGKSQSVLMSRRCNVVCHSSRADVSHYCAELLNSRNFTKCSNAVFFYSLFLPFGRYASLFFVAGINSEDNELITLEIVHRYVEILDRYFGNQFKDIRWELGLDFDYALEEFGKRYRREMDTWTLCTKGVLASILD